ncbi:MAG: nucleotidyltransferase family protein, partial [Synergistes sp.]|nr:nucleotidyltransferase family protein [Synergistes sp.]
MHYPAAGIVAEYNPFHNGHLYHIEQARRESSAEAVVVVLSSDFVQRGEPAMLDKYTRTEAALACGADLVLELPVLFSAHNAGVFANAAVDILAASGIVTHIAFGAEDPNCLTDTLIDILLKESEPFKTLLKKHLKKGLSFVEARARAVNEILPGSAKVLSGSNNTLALAYMKRIKEKNYPLIPLPIKRCGSGYNDKSLKEYASAAAIRRAIREGRV